MTKVNVYSILIQTRVIRAGYLDEVARFVDRYRDFSESNLIINP